MNIKNCISYTSKVKNGLKTPQIFHLCYCRTISENYAKMVRLLQFIVSICLKVTYSGHNAFPYKRALIFTQIWDHCVDYESLEWFINDNIELIKAGPCSHSFVSPLQNM